MHTEVGDHVIVSKAVLDRQLSKRMGTIINIIERYEGKGKYEKIFVVRTDILGMIVHAQRDQLTMVTQRQRDRMSEY